MAKTTFNDVTDLVQSFWSPLFIKELREATLWPGLIKSAYEYINTPTGTQVPIKGGDTLKLNQITKPSSTLKTIGTDASSFNANVLSNSQVELKVDKRAVSAYEFDDLAIVMSQLEDEDSEIREALMADIREQVNNYVKSLIVPSAAAPDHVFNSVTDMNSDQLATFRLTASQAKWGQAEPWYLIADPSYYSDILNDTTLASADYGATDRPIIGGQVSLPRMGFNILEDNSMSVDTAFAFKPSFMMGAFATPRFKISDLHANKEFGYVISVDMVFGVKQYDDVRVMSAVATA